MVKALLAMNEVACESARREELWSLYETIELPLIHTLVVMEKNGIYIDTEKLAELRLVLKRNLRKYSKRFTISQGKHSTLTRLNNWVLYCLKR